MGIVVVRVALGRQRCGLAPPRERRCLHHPADSDLCADGPHASNAASCRLPPVSPSPPCAPRCISTAGRGAKMPCVQQPKRGGGVARAKGGGGAGRARGDRGWSSPTPRRHCRGRTLSSPRPRPTTSRVWHVGACCAGLVTPSVHARAGLAPPGVLAVGENFIGDKISINPIILFIAEV
jgi:hypothetical protein